MEGYVGKVVNSDWYMESIVRWTHYGIVTRSHLSCRIPDRYVVSLVASRINVAGAASRSITGALQEQG